MAKNQTRYATNASNNLINQAQGLTAPILSGFQSSLGGAQQKQGQEFSDIMNLSQDLSGLASTGGYNPGQLSQIEGGYTNFANTGGYTPKQASQFIQRETEGTQSTYGVLQDQARRAEAASGGVGTTGALSQMARQLSQAQGQNTLNAEVALNQSQTANKLAGLGGEANVAGQVASNKIQATEANQSLLNQLYNTTTGQITALGSQVLQTLGLDFSTQSAAISALTQLSRNPGMFQTVFGDLVSAGGAAAGVAGAL